MSRDIVLFLGAGFSKSAGSPVMSQFGRETELELTALRQPQAIMRQAVPSLLNAGKDFSQFQRYCKKVNEYGVRIDENNMEDVFCMAEMLQHAGIPHITLDNGLIEINCLIAEIKLWLWKIYHRFAFFDPSRKDVIHADKKNYEKFVQFLLKDMPNRITVITTNYDLVFEYFAWTAGNKCVYPLAENSAGMIAVVDRKNFDEYVTWTDLDNVDAPIICKLHGSVNFFNDQTRGFYIAGDVAIDGDVIGMSHVRRDSRPAIFMQDAVWYMKRKYGRQFVPAIIPPTYAKLSDETWIKAMWGNALKALSEAKLILFIGYSMPDSDGFMAALMRAAMAGKITTECPEVYVVDSDDENKILCRYKNIFPNFSDECFLKTDFVTAWAQGGLQKIF